MPAYYARCVYNSTLGQNGADLVNTFHLEVDALTSPPNWASIATDVDAWLTTLYRAVVDVNTVVHALTVTSEDYPGAVLGQGFKSIESNGTRATADNLLSPALTRLAHFSTDTPKRYSRGRMWLPPAITSSSLGTNGGWSAAAPYFLTAKAFLDALGAGHNAGSTSYNQIIFSRTRVNQGLTPFIFPVKTYILQPHQYFWRPRLTVP